MNQVIKLLVSGASGRMGREIIRTILAANNTTLAVAAEHSKSESLGKDAGRLVGLAENGVLIKSVDNIDCDKKSGEQFTDETDVWIEFTTPEATLTNLQKCRQLGKPMLIGTTGIDADDQQLIHKTANEIPILLAANTSVGVNLCAALAEIAAKTIGSQHLNSAAEPTKNSPNNSPWDIEIIESHHRHKVDAPSGTALMLGEKIANATGRTLDADGIFSRHGQIGPRQPGSIGFSTIRGGDMAGEHTMLFIGDGERVEITHRATNRAIFAAGAIRAAIWLADKPPGLYSMQDVLQI